MTKVIGLISGTSVDGIDAALVEISGTDADIKVDLLAGETYPYNRALREKILEVCEGKSVSMEEFAFLDDAIAVGFANAAIAINTGYPQADLIGSHGQTVYHRPPKKALATGRSDESASRQGLEIPNSQSPILGYSLQIGRGSLIAHLTGIATVSNFRVADIVAGGEGAPLVSKVDAYLLSHPTESRCIQNIGGIGNVTYLPARTGKNWDEGICGWDTGPGNALLDLAVKQISGGTKTYDEDGAIAAAGTPCLELVEKWLRQEYFGQSPPKSTGKELFGPGYLQQCLTDAEPYQLSPSDLLATLAELTVASIAREYRTFLPKMPDRVLLCGGGSRNVYLKKRLAAKLAPVPVLTTDEEGLSADYKEAIAFAILGYWRQLGIPGNLPQVTGAHEAVLLGEIHKHIPPDGVS